MPASYRCALFIAILLSLASALSIWGWAGSKSYYATNSETVKHLGLAYQVHASLQKPLPLTSALCTEKYPPVPYAVANVYFALAGGSTEAAALTSLGFFSALSSLCVFLLACSLTSRGQPQDYAGALLASLLMAAVNVLLVLIDGFLPDIALMGMTSLGLYCLVLSDGLRHRGYCLLLGLVLGLGILTKWTYPLFLALPILVSLFTTLRASRHSLNIDKADGRGGNNNEPLAGLKGLALVLLTALMISSPWLLSNGSILLRHFSTTFQTNLVGADLHSPQPTGQGISYLLSLLEQYYTPLFGRIFPSAITALFLAGVGYYLLRPKHLSIMTGALIATVLGTYLLFFESPENSRYAYPVIPFAILVGVSWLKAAQIYRWLILLPYGLVFTLSLGGWLTAQPLPTISDAPYKLQFHSWQDPLGLTSSPKRQTLELAAQRIAALAREGYLPVFSFSIREDNNPLLAEVYNYAGPIPIVLQEGNSYLQTYAAPIELEATRQELTALDPSRSYLYVSQSKLPLANPLPGSNYIPRLEETIMPAHEVTRSGRQHQEIFRFLYTYQPHSLIAEGLTLIY